MKPKIQLLIILFPLFIGISEKTDAQSPDWLWAKSMGTTSDDGGRSIALDSFGNVYTSGYFSGTVDFNPGIGTFNLTSTGDYDIFISKSDSSGNFVWAKAMGGTGRDVSYSIALDNSGNVYTTGNFQVTADFDPGPGTFNLTSVFGIFDIFISKLDGSGNFVWAKAMSTAINIRSYSIALDASCNVYTTGAFFHLGPVDFDPGPGTFYLTSVFGNEIFISKLDSSGNFVWAKAMGGTSGETGYSIAIDSSANGNVYTTGIFLGTADFDPDSAGTFNLTSAGDNEVFISKLDSSGNFIWAKAMGGTSGDFGYSLALDPSGSGDVYITGVFQGTADFDPDSAGTFNLTSAGFDDIFISKLDSSGNFVWAKAMGGTNGNAGFSIALDASGDVYTTGTFYGTADFDPDSQGNFNLTAAGGYDIFISKLDGSGNFVWAKAMGGTSDDFGYAIVINAFKNAYITGYFKSPSITFGATTLTNPGFGTPDIFIAKLDTVLSTENNEVENFERGISIFPNPATNHLTIALLNNNENVAATITDITGKIIYTTTATKTKRIEVCTKDFAKGMYLVKIQAAEYFKIENLIITR